MAASKAGSMERRREPGSQRQQHAKEENGRGGEPGMGKYEQDQLGRCGSRAEGAGLEAEKGGREAKR